MTGPLEGVRVVELAGIGPGPFAGMLLADMGADVVRVDRIGVAAGAAAGVAAGTDGDRAPTDVLGRGRRSVAVDLKHPEGRDVALRLVDGADALIEGFRPGVAERLGVGPDACLARNPRLVYGRMTGWGQDGPYAGMAGHDINYLALSGTLSLLGRRGDPPTPPANLLGDFGGGGMLLGFGLVCGLLEAQRSGRGQVIDAAVVDGSALLAAMLRGFEAAGAWGPRGTNLLDTGAWYYDVFETADGGWISLGSLEPQFFAELVRLTGLAADVDGRGPAPDDRDAWPGAKERLAAVVATRTRDEWCALLEGTDVCFAPVLDLAEAAEHPQARARQAFVDVAGVTQPAPAPRFSRTPGRIRSAAPAPGADTDAVLADAGLTLAEIAALRAAGAVA